MRSSEQLTPEQRSQWIAFLASIHPAGDPPTSRLMDEFYYVSHQITHLLESSLETAGISFAQFRILLHLSFCEWAGGCRGLNPSEISEHQGTRRNTISALIRNLEDSGLVERHLDPVDRRRFNIHLTDAGRQKVLDHTNNHIRTINTLFDILSPEEKEVLTTTLHKLNIHAQALKVNRPKHDAGDEHATR